LLPSNITLTDRSLEIRLERRGACGLVQSKPKPTAEGVQLAIIQGSGPRWVVTCALALQAAVLVACSQDPATRRQQFLDSGNRYFDQAKYQEAIVEFRNAVQADSASGPARLRLAQSYERIGDASNALAQYVRAADLLPADASVQLKAGGYLLSARRFDEAKARAEAVLSASDRNVEAQVLLGNALAGLRNIDQAIEEMEQAIRLDPTRGATYTNLGLLEISRGGAEAAEAAFKRSIALEPKWVPGHLALANHYLAGGKVADAERELKVVLGFEPAHPLANRALALLYLSTNRPAEAEPHARILASSGASPLALADFYLLQNRSADAIPELQRLRGDARSGTEAGHRLAQAYASKGDRAEAHKTVDELLKRDSKDREARLLKGQLLAAEGKKDAALTELEAAAAIDPSSASLQFALGRVHASRGEHDLARQAFSEAVRLNPRAAEPKVEIARLDLLEGRFDASAQQARDAVRHDPKNLDAQITLVRALVATRDLAGADSVLTPLLAAYPKVSALHVQRGYLASAKNDPAQARRSFNDALAVDPRSADALGGIVALDSSAGRHEEARRTIAAAIAAQPDRADLQLVSARVEAAAKNYAAAETTLRRALQLDPALLAGYVLLGQVYVAEGRLTEARREFDTLASKQPKPVSALTMLGMLAQAQGDAAAAQRYFERVIEIEPSAAVAANNLAWMYADRGEKLDTALRLAQTAAQALPKVSEVQDTLGWVYYKSQTPDRAVAVLRDTVRLAPENATYRYHLGLAYVQAGDQVQARAALERALAIAPAFPEHADARRILAGLPRGSATSR
jgi:tetratricopeptide (TPR) repeat protein